MMVEKILNRMRFGVGRVNIKPTGLAATVESRQGIGFKETIKEIAFTTEYIIPRVERSFGHYYRDQDIKTKNNATH